MKYRIEIDNNTVYAISEEAVKSVVKILREQAFAVYKKDNNSGINSITRLMLLFDNGFEIKEGDSMLYSVRWYEDEKTLVNDKSGD